MKAVCQALNHGINMDVNQFHDELRDSFNTRFRETMVKGYMSLTGMDREWAERAVDRMTADDGEGDK